MRNKVEFMMAGADVMRYHTVRTIQAETVGHHSHGVAMFCFWIAGVPSRELLLAAMFHDLAEHQLGDIPSPAKKKYGIGEQVNELERQLLESMDMGVCLADSEKRTLKLADIFQGMVFCLKEIRLGNKQQSVIFDRYASYAEDMILVGNERYIYNVIQEMYNECK